MGPAAYPSSACFMSKASDRFKKTVDNATRYTQSVIDDFRASDIPVSLKRDFRETYDFYVTDEERAKMAQMGPFKKSLFSTYYMARGLFLKLTPARRLVVLMAAFLAWGGLSGDGGESFLAFLLLLFLLGLELKDKTVARDELQEGRAVQLAIMPVANPSLDGWELWFHSSPANDVGGDLVDYLELDENRLAITLGDVAGKGLPAALLAAKMQATIRAVAPDEDDLSRRAAKLNHIIRRDGLPERFVSLIHLELTANSGEVSFINAGHHPPILVRENGLENLERGDPAMGLSSDITFESTTLNLSDNDMMVIYSDGVTEARNEIGRFYSDERFADLIELTHGMSARSLGERILKSVEDFVLSARPSDDLSLIVLRRLPR